MKLWSAWRRLLVLLSVAFLMSAWLYCLATMRTAKNPSIDTETSELILFFRDNGAIVLAAELAGLAICAAVLVWTDRRRRDTGSAVTQEEIPSRGKMVAGASDSVSGGNVSGGNVSGGNASSPTVSRNDVRRS